MVKFLFANPILASSNAYKSLYKGWIIVSLSMSILTGCDNNVSQLTDNFDNSDTQAQHAQDLPQQSVNLQTFAGCYTSNIEEPVLLKISQQKGGWVMQMKEPTSTNRVWDDPESLEAVDLSELDKFFSLDPNYVTALIGRPDRMMVLAHADPAYVALDPMLDSEYLAFVYRGSNTVYKVECDAVQRDITIHSYN